MPKGSNRHYLISGILLLSMLSNAFTQTSVKPVILRTVKPENRVDRVLERLLREQLGDGEARYHYNRVDLNADGIPELMVFAFGEGLCGSSGCRAYIYKKSGRSYRLITEFGPARNPIVVSSTKTKGWNDLIFLNSGGGIFPSYYSIGRFDGVTYPENPTVVEQFPKITKRYKGTAYVSGDYDREAGHGFQANRKISTSEPSSSKRTKTTEITHQIIR